MSPIMLVIDTDLLVLCIDWYGKRPHPPFFKPELKHTSCDLLCICRTPGPATNFYLNNESILESKREGSAAVVITSQS